MININGVGIIKGIKDIKYTKDKKPFITYQIVEGLITIHVSSFGEVAEIIKKTLRKVQKWNLKEK